MRKDSEYASLIRKVPKRVESEGLNKLTPAALFRDIGDDTWYRLNTQGCRDFQVVRSFLPSLPDEDTQTRYVGSAGDKALNEAFDLYRLCKRIFHKQHGNLRTSQAVLDFGCGWGRVIRFFLKDLEPDRLYGVDCRSEIIDICKQTNRWCHFELCNVMPPSSFNAETFDLIFAYSVFSHLSEDAHKRWLQEFHTILRPGGLLVVTTWQRDFIENCERLRRDQTLPCEPNWRETLKDVFLNVEDNLFVYDKGGFCFSPYNETKQPWAYFEGRPCYGEACIPKEYVTSEWPKNFQLLEYIDDRRQCAQNVIAVRKRA